MTIGSLFEGRNAIIFAATGAIARAVAAELGRQRAKLFLSARDRHRLDALVDRLVRESGANVDAALVNAEDQAEVDDYLKALAHRGVHPELVFNGIGVDPADAQYGERSETVVLESFVAPLARIVGSQFLTATRAAGRMAASRPGVIALLSSSLARSAIPHMAGITAASDAVEGLARVLAAEYAPRGIRVACVRLDAIPETRTILMSMAANAKTLGVSVEQFAASISYGKRSARVLTLADASRAIVHVLSDGGTALSSLPVDIAFP
ncbi:MAG: SDR family oxidoreductase [Pseudomonadota bacterium]